MSGGIVASAGASATTIKNAVWNALTSAHTTAGSFGVLLKDELAKFGTLVNTGGTATLGGMIGDTANSTIVQRLDAIPTGGGGGVQTQIAFDNSTFTMTASQTVETIPATGESDTGFVMVNTGVAAEDGIYVSSDSGTTYTKSFTQTSSGTDFNSAGMKITIDNIGNSTGRYKVVTWDDSGTRKYIKCITTIKEEA